MMNKNKDIQGNHKKEKTLRLAELTTTCFSVFTNYWWTNVSIRRPDTEMEKKKKTTETNVHISIPAPSMWEEII